MATSTPTAQMVTALLPKLQDPDADFRFMSLNDLYTALASGSASLLSQDLQLATKTMDGVVKALDDQNGEVQNLAIKCLGPLVTKIPTASLGSLIEKLSSLRTQNATGNSVRSPALQVVVTHLPRPLPGLPPSRVVEESYTALGRSLLPRLAGRVVVTTTSGTKQVQPLSSAMLDPGVGDGVEADAVNLVTDLVSCFGPMLKEREVLALLTAVNNLILDDRAGSVVKKRAVIALSVLAVYFSDALLSSFVSNLTESFRNPHSTFAKRRLLITVAGAMARSIPRRWGRYLQVLAPFILRPLSREDLADQYEQMAQEGGRDPQLDEVREAALIALEVFLASCGADMRPYTEAIIQAALLFLKYDPNVNDDQALGVGADDAIAEKMVQNEDNDHDDEDGDGDELDFQDDLQDDLEEEGGFSDDDDMSWKVRRCAAKLLYTLISTRSSGDLLDDGTLYQKIAPTLVERFREREENVRLEVLATMTCLIRKTSEQAFTRGRPQAHAMTASRSALGLSRKRRRAGSDASMMEAQHMATDARPISPAKGPSSPLTGPQASLVAMTSLIVSRAVDLLKSPSQMTRQACITLLKEMVAVRPGALSNHLSLVIGRLADAMETSSPTSSAAAGGVTAVVVAAPAAGVTSATTSTFRIEALALVAAIAQTHQPKVLRPLIHLLMPSVMSAARDKVSKVSMEALGVIEQFIKVLTPNNLQGDDDPQPTLLEPSYEVLMEHIQSMSSDAEVKQRALRALGVLLARTSGIDSEEMLSPPKRIDALDLICDRLKSETTQLAAVQAVRDIARLALSRKDLPPSWTQRVLGQLASRLRISSRVLKVASLSAMKTLTMNPITRSDLDKETNAILIDALWPLLTADDLNFLGPALVILSTVYQTSGEDTITPAVIEAICKLTVAELAGNVLEALLDLVQTVGERDIGKPLMSSLLKDVGVEGNAAVMGKVIGTLLVSGGPKVGIQLDDFVQELGSAKDDKRKCLALSVLGESGFRLGSASPLTPDTFIAHFVSKSDQVPLIAAVALGRAGSGDVRRYLPLLLERLGQTESLQYLLLQAIKEILHYASEAGADLTPFTTHLWSGVLQTSRSEDNMAVGAECIGRLVIIDPETHLSSVQAYLRDTRPLVRRMMAQAFRYALTDMNNTYDFVLQPIIVKMLTVMLEDMNLENARVALTTLVAASNNKPHLIHAQLGRLLPLVMNHTEINSTLVYDVQMGPFKHRVDEGLELRKSAYETLYTLLEVALPHIDVVTLYDRTVAGLNDEHDIQLFCGLMVSKLIVLEPGETVQRLDSIAECFRATLSTKPKSNAIKQEVEKAEEAVKGVLKITAQLRRAFPNAANPSAFPSSSTSSTSTSAFGGDQSQQQILHPAWKSYWDWVRSEHGAQIRQLDQELISAAAAAAAAAAANGNAISTATAIITNSTGGATGNSLNGTGPC